MIFLISDYGLTILQIYKNKNDINIELLLKISQSFFLLNNFLQNNFYVFFLYLFHIQCFVRSN